MSRRAGRLAAFLGLIAAGAICLAGARLSTAEAGFNQGTGPCSTGNGVYFGLTSTACPFNYKLADVSTSPAFTYAPGEVFTFSLVVYNNTGSDITVPTDWGWHHVLSISDSADGVNPPFTQIDVSNGYTPAGFLPLTDYSYSPVGQALWQHAVETTTNSLTFNLTVPANSHITVTQTGSTTTCGYYELDFRRFLNGAFYTLASGLIRVLGCEATPTPTPTTTTTTSTTTHSTTATTHSTTSTTTHSTTSTTASSTASTTAHSTTSTAPPAPTPTPSSGVQSAVTSVPSTGGGMQTGVGIGLIAGGCAALAFDLIRRRFSRW